MASRILLTINSNTGNAVGQYNIDTAAGTPVHVQAIDGVSYQFTDLSTGIGPDSIVTERDLCKNLQLIHSFIFQHK